MGIRAVRADAQDDDRADARKSKCHHWSMPGRAVPQGTICRCYLAAFVPDPHAAPSHSPRPCRGWSPAARRRHRSPRAANASPNAAIRRSSSACRRIRGRSEVRLSGSSIAARCCFSLGTCPPDRSPDAICEHALGNSFELWWTSGAGNREYQNHSQDTGGTPPLRAGRMPAVTG